MAVHVEEVLLWAVAQKGDRYVLGAEVPPGEVDPEVFDCSELVQFACDRAAVSPVMVDGSHFQLRHCELRHTVLSVEQAVATRGALLFRDRGAAGGGGRGNHVAFSLGDGTTFEARGSKWGVNSWPARRRGWTHGALIPGVRYDDGPVPWPVPGKTARKATIFEEDEVALTVEELEALVRRVVREEVASGVHHGVDDVLRLEGVSGAADEHRSGVAKAVLERIAHVEEVQEQILQRLPV